MAAITAAMVKELRELTGAGMMDCKKALGETDGNMDEAVEYLRKNGQAKAAKKASRIAAEGICCVVKKDDQTAAVVEVNSETDFVAKNEKFQNFVKAVADQVVSGDAADLDALMEEKWAADNSKAVKDVLVEQIAVIGENLKIRRFEKVVAKEGCVVTYVHGGGRIGVIVEAATDVVNDAIKDALTNIAMQVAAMNPEFVCKAEISQAELDKIREITVDSSLNDPASLPKPLLQKLLDKAVNDKVWSDEDIAAYNEQKGNKYLFNFLSEAAKTSLAALAMEDKAAIAGDKIFGGMVDGRVSKQLKEICLMDQVYVKAEDGKQTVGKYVEQVARENGANLSVKRFVRFETGEGIEKKQEDFAAEVAAQMNA